MATDEVVARKHWIVYLRKLLGYGIWFAILLTVLAVNGFQKYHSSPITLAGAIVLILIAISAFIFFLSWMDAKRFTWTAEEERLVLRSGVLPWARTDFGVPYDTIFEAYVNFGFFAKLFGYRTCVIRRTEGVTTETTATYMKNGEEIIGMINRKIKETKAQQYAVPQMLSQMISEAPRVEPAKSPAEQLKELAALKADGTITTEEFDLMKRKIIQG